MKNSKISLISRLSSDLERMSKIERSIAETIILSPQEITEMSSQTLAQKCNVSQSSIIKFCQKIGFRGFPALKITLSAEMARSENAQQIHAGIFSDDSLGSVAKKLFNSKVSAMSETMKMNSNEKLDEAVRLIEKSDRILIMGIGGSALVAQDMTLKLTKFGKSVISSGDSHIQLANLASFRPDDLLVAISYSGKTREISVAVDFAKENNIPVVFVGGFYGDNPPDVLLHCAADESVVRSSSIATRTAQFAITDLLFVLLVQRRDDAAERISTSQELVRKIR